MSHLIATSLFGGFGLKGTASPKVTLSPAGRGTGEQSAFSDWSVQGYKGLENLCPFGGTLNIHPRSRASHRIGVASV